MVALLTPRGTIRRPFICLLLVAVLGCADRVPRSARVATNLQYGPSPTADLLNLYVPQSEQPTPLVIWIHGGAWQTGNGWRNRSPAMGLLDHGYAVANIDYRLTNEAKFPAQIQDCKAAVRWLRMHAANYHIDPNRIGVWGESAGGHLAALLGTGGDVHELDGDGVASADVSSHVQAVCDWYGPTDFLQITTDNRAKGNSALDESGSPVAELLGGRVSEHLEMARLASPVSFVAPGDPPFLILHGEQDSLVPIHQSEILEQALRKAGDDVTLQRVAGAGHGGREFGSAKNQALILSFFDRVLK